MANTLWTIEPQQDPGVYEPDHSNNTLWLVAHTRPRCEKKLVDYCVRHRLSATLPCYNACHEYGKKRVIFRKPLFPGYVFLHVAGEQRAKVRQSDYVANLLEPADQELFIRQLDDILKALEMDLEIRLIPTIGPGTRVRIKYGPLRGVEGWVEQRYGPKVVLLRLDFIGQAAAVQLDAAELELV